VQTERSAQGYAQSSPAGARGRAWAWLPRLGRALTLAAVTLAACSPAPPPGPSAAPAASGPAPAAPLTSARSASEAVAPPSPLSPPRPVRIVNVGLAAQVPTFLAVEEGYFTELGLEPEIVPITTTTDTLALLSSGQLDVGIAAISAGFFNAVARGVAIRMVADHGSYLPGRTTVNLSVRADLPWTGFQDLRGLKVAIQQAGSVLERNLELMLQRGGLQRSDIEVVALPFPDIATAFVNRAIDAASFNEPWATQLEQEGVIRKIAYMDEIEPGGMISGLLFGESFARDTAAARNYMVAYLRGVRLYWDAYDGRAPFQPVIDAHGKYTPLKNEAVIRRIPPTGQNPNGYFDPARLAIYQDWFAERGLVSRKADLQRAIDLSFVDYANAVLGPYQPVEQPQPPS
jgi:NitT/TauT family transport system substrate-binding protein